MDITLNKGNTSNGSNAVTDIETASVIHQKTIHKAVAITISAFSEIISKGKN